MVIPYDTVTTNFLDKVTEFEFLNIPEEDREATIDRYMKRAVSSFKKICKYDLSMRNDEERVFADDFRPEDVDEIVDILSEGMLVQWMKPYVYKQELLENTLNTADYTTYSPSELLLRVGNAYAKVQQDYIQMVREYSYNHGNLSELHL